MPADAPIGLLQLAEYFGVRPPVLEALAERGVLPGLRIGGRWLFHRAEVDRWVDFGMPGWEESVVRCFADGARPPVRQALRREHVLLDCRPADWAACFEQVVATLGVLPGLDRGALLAGLIWRERLCPTVADGGVALPHTSRRGPWVMPTDLVVVARAVQPVPLAAGPDAAADVFFFVLAASPRSQLRLLARLTALARRQELLARLRAARSAGEVVEVVSTAERECFSESEGVR